jgi:hypothetical protein
MARVGRVRNPFVLGMALWLAAAPGVRADNDPAVIRGLALLRGRATSQGTGESALIGLALVKADVPASDPALAACITKVRARFKDGAYAPERTGGADVYEAGVVSMFLANIDAVAYRAELNMIAQFLAGKQKAGGGWDYDHRQAGDTSISQYAVLGLWEAENGGADVHPSIWERAAQWYLSTQSTEGSWNYHRDESGQPETISMTAAGMGSLLICQKQLTRYGRSGDLPSTLLVPLVPEGKGYEVKLSFNRIDQAVRRASGWIVSNLSFDNKRVFGPSVYYGLYGVERIVALSGTQSMGRSNLYEQGRRYILATQQNDGGWTADFGEDMNTVWALLFLTKSTTKTLRRIQVKRLGAGTLLGGRGLPSDLSSMTVAGGRVVSRPMNGAVEGMLAVLEDPRAEDAQSALSGLVNRYQARGPSVLRPYKDRFRKLLTDRDPGLRRVAAWALGHMAELDVVPALIDALADPDDDVVDAARVGLQLLSRKIEGYGPRLPSTADDRVEAARKWREWYDSIRPIELEGQSGGDSTAPAGAAKGAP